MKQAIVRAMNFYFEASLFIAGSVLKPDEKRTPQKLRYARHADEPFSEMDDHWSQTLELDPSANTGEAREYLKQQGCYEWNGRTVLRKICEICGRNGDELLGNDKRPGKWTRIDRTAKLQTDLAVLNTLLAGNQYDATTCAELDRRAQAVRQLLDVLRRSPPAWQLVDGKVSRVKEGKEIYDIPLFVLDELAKAWKAQENKRKRNWAQKHRKKRGQA